LSFKSGFSSDDKLSYLLKTVERTLSQTDSEVNKCIHPDTVTDHVQNKTLISKKKDELNDSCDTITDHEELSIYDIDRSSSTLR
jgi:hypothetical protein